MATSSLAALLLSLTTLLSGLTAQLNSLQIKPASQLAQVVSSSQKTSLTPSDFTYLGYYDVLVDGNNTTYSGGLTHRYVNGQLRLLILGLSGLKEMALPSTFGTRITNTTGNWTLSGTGDNLTGFWWDEAKQKLWVTSSIDYGSSSVYYPTKISTVTLGANGPVTNIHTVSLQGISSKRVYGGALALPSWFQSQYGCGPYAVGFGGYTSLMDQTSKASLGPELICIPDISNYPNGAEIPTSAFKVLLDTVGNRGYRLWTPGTWPQGSPVNYFDGGDTRQNPSSRPTVPPASGAGYLSPNPQGHGWMVWGDSYYNTGMWIDTGTKHGYVAIAALCKGFCWYQSSTLAFDGRTQELHIWDPNTLGNGFLTRPTSMTELNIPRGNNSVWSGNTPAGNISGATYDATTGRMYLYGSPLGPDVYTGRIYVYQVSGGGTGTPPPTSSTPTPTDAVVSSWSAWTDTSGWSTCVNGTQTKTQQRTRTVITAATNGGSTPALSETQTVSQSCTTTTIQPVQTNPVGYWKLDETSGLVTVDSSGNGNNGTLNNGPVWTTGKKSNGLNFDGSNDYVLIGNPANLIPGNFITMMGWAKFDRNDVSQAIVSKYGNNSNITQLRLQGTGEVRCSVGGTTITTSGAGVTAGNWHHLACTYDGSTITVYVDGVIKGTTSRSGSIADSTGVSWRIGGLELNSMYMDGVIDEVKIYNRALSASEIVAEISSTTNTTPTPTDAVVSSWSAWTDTSGWSTCVNGTQTKTQQRTRTVITAATNGGSTPALSETQTVSQSCTIQTTTSSQTTLNLNNFVYQGYHAIRTNGNDSTYSQGLTHRYVNGELRFISLTLQGQIQEYRLPAAGQTQTSVTGSWQIPSGSGNNFNGLWYEQAKNRLWVTSAQDYTATNFPAKISLIQLNSDGTATLLKRFYLNVTAKRVYGGCQAVPAALVSQLGGSYVCGWGGYTSLVMQGGNASIGPTMYAIPDPDTIADGSTVTARTVLDTANAQTNRGFRATIPLNYFDGGDPRNNPSTRPTSPPDPSANWLSPNSQGYGWMVWGDSYYNTGFWIGNTFGAVASLCKGACWYQSSTLAFDGRQFELHTWDGTKLGNNILQRPDYMSELVVPISPTRMASGAMGNTPVNNLAGATYDPVSNKLFIIGFAMHDAYTARIYEYNVTGAGTPPPTSSTPTPTDAVVSSWSAWTDTSGWSTCVNGTQTKTQQRTRTVITAATNGGSTPALSETQTVSQSCTIQTTTNFSIGDMIQTTANVNVRVVGGGTLLGTQPMGSTGKIVAGPTYSNGVTWWQIDYTSGIDGWSGENYLVKYTSTPTPTDAVVSSWSAWTDTSGWSTCVNGTQTKTQQRTRTVITAATNGGSTPALSETQTVSQSCTTEGTLASTKFIVGDSVETTANVNVRSTPSTSGALLGTQATGMTGKVVGGPVYADGLFWWQIDYSDGADGWSAENFIAEISTSTTSTSTSVTNKFIISDDIQTTAKINVRLTPGGRRLGSQNRGVYGTVISGPVRAEGYTWWKINYVDGADGWSVENFLIKR